jgi:hypothetical protein
LQTKANVQKKWQSSETVSDDEKLEEYLRLGSLNQRPSEGLFGRRWILTIWTISAVKMPLPDSVEEVLINVSQECVGPAFFGLT